MSFGEQSHSTTPSNGLELDWLFAYPFEVDPANLNDGHIAFFI